MGGYKRNRLSTYKTYINTQEAIDLINKGWIFMEVKHTEFRLHYFYLKDPTTKYNMKPIKSIIRKNLIKLGYNPTRNYGPTHFSEDENK